MLRPVLALTYKRPFVYAAEVPPRTAKALYRPGKVVVQRPRIVADLPTATRTSAITVDIPRTSGRLSPTQCRRLAPADLGFTSTAEPLRAIGIPSFYPQSAINEEAVKGPHYVPARMPLGLPAARLINAVFFQDEQ